MEANPALKHGNFIYPRPKRGGEAQNELLHLSLAVSNPTKAEARQTRPPDHWAVSALEVAALYHSQT